MSSGRANVTRDVVFLFLNVRRSDDAIFEVNEDAVGELGGDEVMELAISDVDG